MDFADFVPEVNWRAFRPCAYENNAALGVSKGSHILGEFELSAKLIDAVRCRLRLRLVVFDDPSALSRPAERISVI